MSDTDLLPWPRFVLKKLACPEGTPDEVRQALSRHGVPARGVGAEYAALDEAVFLDSAPHLLAFGEAGDTERICVDVRSLEVVHVPAPGSARVNPVNANLEAFSACVEAVIAPFPYYTYETWEERGDKVVSFLRDQLLAIDDTTNAHNGMWETFLDDVATGDYAEEEYERPPGR
jgi:SUKH-4 immunity protein